MSSPIARKDADRTAAHRAVIRIHRMLSHSRRLDRLAARLVPCFRGLAEGGAPLRCLDVGCGDMGISRRIGEEVPQTRWECLDVHDLPARLADDPEWKRYRKFDGTNIPLADDAVDVVLFCDVLHHAGDSVPRLLAEARRVGTRVVVKDSLEYSPWSRRVLQAMDFVGNWGYGVPLPRRYFTVGSFRELCDGAGLAVARMEVGVRLYDHLPVLRSLLRPEWHFVAVLERKAGSPPERSP